MSSSSGWHAFTQSQSLTLLTLEQAETNMQANCIIDTNVTRSYNWNLAAAALLHTKMKLTKKKCFISVHFQTCCDMICNWVSTFKGFACNCIAVLLHRQQICSQQGAVLLPNRGSQSSLLDDILDMHKDLPSLSAQQTLSAWSSGM